MDFEVQVAEALSQLMIGSHLPERVARGISLTLAPRVAAALEAAALAGFNEGDGRYGPARVTAWREVGAPSALDEALKALQGA